MHKRLFILFNWFPQVLRIHPHLPGFLFKRGWCHEHANSTPEGVLRASLMPIVVILLDALWCLNFPQQRGFNCSIDHLLSYLVVTLEHQTAILCKYLVEKSRLNYSIRFRHHLQPSCGHHLGLGSFFLPEACIITKLAVT